MRRRQAEPGLCLARVRTIRACNAYLDGTQQAGLVLTCRTDQYQALGQSKEWVRDAAQIRSDPSQPKARAFLVRRVTDEDRWRPVLTGMKRAGNRRSETTCSACSSPTLTAVHHGPHPAGRVHQWLGTLARYLNSNTARRNPRPPPESRRPGTFSAN